MKDEKEIIIMGTGREALNVYDYLVDNGIEACCFMSLKGREPRHRLFGKQIVRERDARKTYKNPVFIDCIEKGSAWGMSRVDYYDYLGYRRNEQFILLRDYLEIPENNLIHALKKVKVALAGDFYLCRRLFEYLSKRTEARIVGYVSILSDRDQCHGLPECSTEEFDGGVMLLVVNPTYCSIQNGTMIRKKEVVEWVECLEENGIDHYTDYFSDMTSFIHLEADNEVKYTQKRMRVKRTVLGSIEAYNGNDFFRGLLDNHPFILMVLDFRDFLNNNLFWICVCLSMEENDRILSVFWKLIEGNEKGIFNPSVFNEKMEELLAYESRFTSQELFVMIHIAYMHMCGRNMDGIDEKDMMIYWEPHFLERSVMEEYVRWLGTGESPCDIINVVRNICPQHGSKIKYALWGKVDIFDLYDIVLEHPPIDKKRYKDGERVVVRFEDLKCNAKDMLLELCKKWDIPWSDTLLETTCNGKESSSHNAVRYVKGFDLEPVYNIYEKFFSEFDRFRIMLINTPWQKKYGYPYVELAQFSRRDLQEMFLKEFRFEKLPKFEGESKNELTKELMLQKKIRSRLQKIRMIEFLSYEGNIPSR